MGSTGSLYVAKYLKWRSSADSTVSISYKMSKYSPPNENIEILNLHKGWDTYTI